MTTAILGLGNMGAGLARRLSGTNLILGARNPAAAADLGSQVGAPVVSYAEAIAKAEVIVLALPLQQALKAVAGQDLTGKVLVDISNPMTADFNGLTLGFTTSAAEELQKVAPGAKVVKAFNTIFSGVLDAARAATVDVPVFLAGDDMGAIDAVAALVTAAGFTPERSGPLDSARLLEPMGLMNVRFAYGLGRGTAIAPAWVKLAA